MTKQMLTSLRGKFAHRANIPKMHYIYDPAKLVKKIEEPIQIIKDFHMLNRKSVKFKVEVSLHL